MWSVERPSEEPVNHRIVHVFEEGAGWRVAEEGDDGGTRFRTREAAMAAAARLAREKDSGIVLGPPPQGEEEISIPSLGPPARA